MKGTGLTPEERRYASFEEIRLEGSAGINDRKILIAQLVSLHRISAQPAPLRLFLIASDATAENPRPLFPSAIQ